MRRFIENHFGIVLIIACALGMVIPGLALLPNETAVGILAVLMFVSCYKLHEGGLKSIRWHDISIFYVGRYALLPLILWALAQAFIPSYATGVFLLSVLPAGVSSPAIAAIYGGAVAPGFAIVIVSQLLAPLLIPLQFALIGSSGVTPSPAALFATMAWCILLPMAIYALARNHKRSAAYFYAQNKFFSVLLVAFVIALAIAKQREVILTHVPQLLAALVVTIACFMIYIAAGWLIPARRPRDERIAYATCSSFNNAALGVSLALLHFPSEVILFVAVSEIGWALLPLLFKLFLRGTV